MEQKRAIDGFGAAALIGFATLLAFNQVVIKWTGSGFNPLFQAGIRSVLGFVVLVLWMAVRRQRLGVLPRGAITWGVIAGLLFAFEFLCLFAALDLGSVARVSILFYSMPVWLALVAHFLLPGEALTPIRAIGLVLAMGGVVLALLDRDGGTANLWADALALLAAFGWAAIALCLRLTPQAHVPPVTQLFFQLLVSAPVMLILAPIFGPLIRDPQPIHYASLAFQAVFIASFGYMLWFSLIKRYRASSVASFSFLSPVLAVLMGWILLGERVGPEIWAALGLVAVGVVLINRK
ncbi:DMT family transporter [Aliisedimentitalea scapharcae]|uniref:DMT family transporter n=1 Tax=Aliisedimentitalea scapharcae TaxID=1524259 RepID=A0ABZ2XQI3_9RHOB|nr:DMT family transporter [Rhodobacteraceae bacterium M382]